MREETRKELDELLDAYEQKREAAEKRAERRFAEGAEFDADFRFCREKTIVPVMEEIGEQLRSRGHECSISFNDEDTPPVGRPIPAQASIEFYPAGIDRSKFAARENTPHVSFIANLDKRTVLVSLGDRTPDPDTGTHVGPVGVFSLKEIDKNFVENQIRAMLRGVVGK